MQNSWIRPVEQIVLPAIENRVRILGFTAAQLGVGVTSLAQSAAQTLARSGTKTLLLDLSAMAGDIGDTATDASQSWAPGAQGIRALIQRSPDGYDVLAPRPQGESRYLFNNSKRLRSTLTEELSGYGAIVVDLPPLLGNNDPSGINPVAAALLCDSVLLVAAKGKTTHNDIAAAASLGRASGVKLTGSVFNDLGLPVLAEEVAQSVRRRLGFMPWIERRLEAMARTSPLLR